MTLYVLNSSLFEAIFGTPAAPICRDDVTIIGQKPDCSSFLVLSSTAYEGLVPQYTIPEGYDFTYCQEWGLTIDDNVLERVKKSIRSNAVEAIIVKTKSGKLFDGDEISQERISRAILTMDEFQIASMKWKLADNTVSEVLREEMAEALLLAGTAQSDLWFI